MSKQPKSLGKLAVLQQQVEELTLALQRERADADNIRRNHDKQIGELRNMVKANVISELVPLVDNIDRALAHIPKQTGSKLSAESSQLKAWEDWAKGVSGVKAQFDKALQDMGIERIKTVGKVFDPHLHEAVGADGDGEHEIVSEELQAGYKLGDQIVRHAMVRIRRAK